jgi:superfamily I DNA/RNA helicase
MPKEKWLIDPGELDEFQRDIRGLSTKDSYVVKGCAGSGKTILALYRVNDIRIEALAEDELSLPSFTMVVYTKALRGFIRSGVLELGIPIKQVIHYDKWDGSEVDYVVVDEAQDFSKEEIDILVAAKRTSVMLYGDTHQQLYSFNEAKIKQGGVYSIEGLATYLGIPEKQLLKNYRLPKPIASFASHLTADKDLESRCVKDGSQKPRLVKFSSWQAELDFIINEINTRDYTDVAILLPFNIKKRAPTNNGHRNVETVKEYFDSVGFRHEFKMRDDDNDSVELDFDSVLPKVITFHSSKGLQFETVFIPFCDCPNHDTWFANRFQNPLYVASTRTYRNLYITYSEKLSPFINGIANSKFA